MVACVIYMDGEVRINLFFPDMDTFFCWNEAMSCIKEHASRIHAVHPESQNQPEENLQSMKNWLLMVDAVIATNAPVLPSILQVRLTYINIVTNHA